MLNLVPFVLQVNVFLRITNKREDGFHDLASLFHVSIFKLKLLLHV
jgi:4-diphosphocytidyl-2C-methyl-D-erythritol kinase